MVACALMVWSLALSDGTVPPEATFKPAPPVVPLPAPPALEPLPPPPAPPAAATPMPGPEPGAQSMPPAAPPGPAPRIFQAPPPREPAGQPSLSAQVAAISRRWYGWQLILSDAAFYALGTLTQHGPATVVASAGLTFGAPALHFANG